MSVIRALYVVTEREPAAGDSAAGAPLRASWLAMPVPGLREWLWRLAKEVVQAPPR